jgi:hypothetical protein
MQTASPGKFINPPRCGGKSVGIPGLGSAGIPACFLHFRLSSSNQPQISQMAQIKPAWCILTAKAR